MITWLTLISLLHLLALTLWLGGMVFFLVVFGPAVHQLKPSVAVGFLNRGRVSFESLSWAGIALVMLTGMANLVLRNQETGAHLGQQYMIILSLKLLVFVAMLIHHSLQVFKYGPMIATLTSQVGDKATIWPEPLRTHWQRWFRLLKINATLGPIAVLFGLFLVKH